MATKTHSKIGHHANEDYAAVAHSGYSTYKRESEFTYTFENFFHPFVGELIEKLNKESLVGLLDPEFHKALGDVTKTPSSDLPGSYYSDPPHISLRSLVSTVFHKKAIDVTPGGPYANYNWELFFHIPLTIAVHLSKNQRFAEAQRWFHFIFDPTASNPWKFIAFRPGSAGKQIDELLALLSDPEADPAVKQKILEGYTAITDNPFQPHRVARTRHLAYMYCVVMKYLDNLIAWGDHLFRQDTLESINEATQIYVLAANILGQRPEKIPLRGTVRPKTFAQLKVQGLDPMGNALVELEGVFPFNHGIPTGSEGADAAAPLFGIGRTLYFCIPRNDKLLTYWDTVADRLFKIRHCMNIEGVVRPLALFDPPLDPGMLVKAAAAGIDIGAIVAGLNQPVSPVRAQLLIQKALELCAEVRNLGGALLSAIEKGDGERLALLRQGHEIKIQQLQQEVRFLQWKQAQEATESLLRTRAVVLERYKYYLRLLGQTPDGNLAPDELALDRRELTEENFDEAYEALVGQYEKEVPVLAYPPLSLEGGGSPAGQAGAQGQGTLALITNESDEISHLTTARDLTVASTTFHSIAATLTPIPDTKVDLHYWGLGGTIDLKVGTALATVARITGDLISIGAAWERDQAGMASRYASYQRRADDWTLQVNLAARELRQIGRQVVSSLINEQIAYREYQNIQQQIEHSQEVDRFLREKFTNADLYAWMQGELSRLYYEYYRFAFDVARRAEQTMKRELMRPELDSQTLVKFNYWDGGRKGLLSGEALYLDVKRMEMAYHEHNKREYELTRHISLQQLDPLALLTLKATGKCEVSIPEWLYDRDCPGHYLRRLKSVGVSVPCVVGPYTSVNCTLTLLRSRVRKSPLLADDVYARQGSEDDRFVDYTGAVQSVVTSGASNDTGMFETNLRDERFLPFEGAGAVSTWRLELPSDFRPFDYKTISDVVLHVRYTARQGGQQLGQKAIEEMREMLSEASQSGLALLFSLRHDFPTEWYAFVNGNDDFSARLRKDHFPYMVQSETLAIDSLELHAVDVGRVSNRTIDVPASLADELNGDDRASTLSLPADPANEKVLTRDALWEVFLVVGYHFE